MEQQTTVDIVKQLIEKLGGTIHDFQVEDDVSGGTLYIVETQENKLLIGEGGTRLQAINYIAKRIAEQKNLPTTFHVDIGGYAASHKRKLSDMAKIYAERARFFGTPVHLDPMNPYDRLVVHAALAHMSDISTQSEGVGMNRHVVISLKPKEELVV
jgi:spoIIIJ-associated protein